MTNLISAGIAFVLAFFPSQVSAETVPETVYVPQGLSSAQIIWLAKLMDCESGVSTHALNPSDSNGLASRNILQFQDATFDAFTVKYGIDVTRNDTAQEISEAQVEIVSHWILNQGEVRFESQFPACVRKLGLPPA